MRRVRRIGFRLCALGFAFAGPVLAEDESRGTVPSLPREIRAPVAASDAPCSSWVTSYALAARLRLTDTPLGAGDGIYDIGPGRLELRFTRGPSPGGPIRVDLLAYAMRDHFVVDSSVLFIRAQVTTRTETRTTPDARGLVATGILTGKKLAWATPVRGYRVDGTLHCKGGGCGFSGVPPSGTTPLHIAPGPVGFRPFVFGSDEFDTFTMDYSKVAKTEMPRQTAFVSLSGRRMSRQCSDRGSEALPP